MARAYRRHTLKEGMAFANFKLLKSKAPAESNRRAGRQWLVECPECGTQHWLSQKTLVSRNSDGTRGCASCRGLFGKARRDKITKKNKPQAVIDAEQKDRYDALQNAQSLMASISRKVKDTSSSRP